MEKRKEKMGYSSHLDGEEVEDSSREEQSRPNYRRNELVSRPSVAVWRVVLSLALLFLNYFLAQYDKFILSYFQNDVIQSLNLSESEYGILSGYATGIVYALLALPTAYIADYTGARVWVLTITALWWSLCAIFQGLSKNFWQILLARIGMGIGQAPVEALSVSLISDLMGKEFVFFGERREPFLNTKLCLILANHVAVYYMWAYTLARLYQVKYQLRSPTQILHGIQLSSQLALSVLSSLSLFVSLCESLLARLLSLAENLPIIWVIIGRACR